MRRVLVIDDHEPSRKILIDTLSQDGYQIAGEGATGNTAVALTTTTLPDIVLMAVGLPDAPLEMICVNYRVTELHGWVIVTPTGKAENNEPLQVKYLFKHWLAKGVPVIVNLCIYGWRT
jgi:DNA-binding response OmpR family regulator